MTVLPRPRFWTASRLFALAAVAVVIAVFVVANAHLIAVSFASRPDCVLQPSIEGATVYAAAKPSC